jgi:hypothetical protein
VRRTPAILAVTVLAAVGLVGCSSASAPACPPSSSQTGDLVSVSGEVGTAPTSVSVRAPFRAEETTTATLDRGDGPEIVTETQAALVDVTVLSGQTGESVVSTRYADDIAQVPSLGVLAQTFPGLPAALQCATEGSRIAVGLAPGDIAEAALPGLGLEDGDSAVLVVDVRKVYLPRADGADQYTESHGLPTVVRAPDGRPGVIVPDAQAPGDLVVQTIKRGDGPEVTGDAPVRVHYTGVLWDTREVFDTTWDAEPASLTLDGVVPGFAEALRGQTVGSQVLAVIPPDQGYGDQAQGAIPAGSTLVFVIDILGVDEF